jgi:hypothetical protein
VSKWNFSKIYEKCIVNPKYAHEKHQIFTWQTNEIAFQVHTNKFPKQLEFSIFYELEIGGLAAPLK